MSEYARAEDGTLLELFPYADNWAALQAFVDAHAAIQLPAGDWWISKPLNLGNKAYEFAGKGADATILRNIGTFGGPVLGIGADGTYAGSSGYGAADGTFVRGMTLYQEDDSSAHCKCLYVINADDFLAENVRVQGGSYEGIVTGSDIHGVTLRDIEAWDCGNGGPAYSLSTAGINATSIDLTIEDFICRGCGQGVETGNTRVTVRRGVVTEPGPGLPNIGINVGSSVYGVWRTAIEDCVVDGYMSAIQCSSGNGRIAGVYHRRNKIYLRDAGASAITFSGGALDNSVPHPDEGPTTEGSEITDNEIVGYHANNGGVIYNSGIDDNNGLFGREPLLVYRNIVRLTLADQSDQVAPIFGVAGEVGATVGFYENEFHGMDAAPARGDLATFTNVGNPAIANMPTLGKSGNIAYDASGVRRTFVNMIEGS